MSNNFNYIPYSSEDEAHRNTRVERPSNNETPGGDNTFLPLELKANTLVNVGVHKLTVKAGAKTFVFDSNGFSVDGIRFNSYAPFRAAMFGVADGHAISYKEAFDTLANRIYALENPEVAEIALQSVVVSSDADYANGRFEVNEGGSLSFTVMATFSDNTQVDVTNLATINITGGGSASAGTYTAPASVSANTDVTIAVSYTDNGVTKTHTLPIRVKDTAPAVTYTVYYGWKADDAVLSDAQIVAQAAGSIQIANNADYAIDFAGNGTNFSRLWVAELKTQTIKTKWYGSPMNNNLIGDGKWWQIPSPQPATYRFYQTGWDSYNNQTPIQFQK